MRQSRREPKSWRRDARDEVVRDWDGLLLGNKRLDVFLGHVDAFAGRFAEKRLGELDKHGDGSRRSTNGVKVHIASRPSPGSPGPALGVADAAAMPLNVAARREFHWQTQDCIAIVKVPPKSVPAKEAKFMSSGSTVHDLNRELAHKINEEALRDPQSPYANKFVGIANGQVAVVADDFDEMIRRIRQIEPDPTKTFGVEASRDYSVVEEIWGLR